MSITNEGGCLHLIGFEHDSGAAVVAFSTNPLDFDWSEYYTEICESIKF